jgi:hypothetical protein
VIFAVRLAFRALVRITGLVLPVLEHAGRQVDTVEIDLGTGLREWIEIRHREHRMYCATTAERDLTLREHGIDPAALVAVDSAEDGSE